MTNLPKAVELFTLMRRDKDRGMRRLLEHFLSAYKLPLNQENVKRFRQLYDYFLHSVSSSERNAERFERLFRATFMEAEPLVDAKKVEQLKAELEQVTARYMREVALRQEEETRRQELGQELNQLRGCTYRSRYSGLFHQLDERHTSLRERKQELHGELEGVETKLVASQELIPELQTPLEKQLHHDAHSLLEQRVQTITNELEEIASELEELLRADLEPVGDSPLPLVSAIHSMKREAAAEGLDALTGLPSRDSFEETLEQQLELFQAEMGEENFSVVILSLSGIDEIDKQHGQTARIALLQGVGHVLQALRRHSDSAYRYGESEFVILLPHTPATGAEVFAGYLHDKLAELRVPSLTATPLQVAGVTGICDAITGGPALVRCAIQACDEARMGGDDTVVFTDERFVDPSPSEIPGDFLAEVRKYLLLKRSFSVAALKARERQHLGALQDRVQKAFSALTSATDHCLFVLLEEWEADAAIREIDARVNDLLMAASATDVGEIPAPAEVPPTARSNAILEQVLEMLA